MVVKDTVLPVLKLIFLIALVEGAYPNDTCACVKLGCFLADDISSLKHKMASEVEEISQYVGRRLQIRNALAYKILLGDKEAAEEMAKIGQVNSKPGAYKLQVLERYDNIKELLEEGTESYEALVKLINYGLRSDFSDEMLIEIGKIKSQLKNIYSSAKTCTFDTKDDTECEDINMSKVSQILLKSKDEKELKYLWEEITTSASKEQRHLYPKYVQLINESDRMSNGIDGATFSYLRLNIKEENIPKFREDLENIKHSMFDLVLQLQAYTRRKLREVYGEKVVSRKGPIPIHILGNMYGQHWDEILKILVPYSGYPNLDITETMLEKGYTPLKMFQDAENFFTSFGFPALPKQFWNGSRIEETPGFSCPYPVAVRGINGSGFIMMCTQVNQRDYLTVHHEMGHVFAFKLVSGLTPILAETSGFALDEAFGDAVSFSTLSLKHLYSLGLYPEKTLNKKLTMNLLMARALDDIPFLLFAYGLTVWRQNVMKGIITEDSYNKAWWKIRYDTIGIKPPSCRSEDYFDVAAKIHIPVHINYLGYYKAAIAKYMMNEAWCKAAGEYDSKNSTQNIISCNIYGSKEVGKLIRDFFSSGLKKHWSTLLEAMTGYKGISAESLMNYYQPLYEWLKADNEEHGEYIGWEDDTTCGYNTSTTYTL